MIIELENGQKLELDDGATPDQIDDAASHFQQSSLDGNEQPASVTPSQPSPNVSMESIFGGMVEKPTAAQQEMASMGSRFLQGVKDAPNAIGQAMLHGAEWVQPGLTDGAATYLDRELASNEMAYQNARKLTGNDGVDWMRAAGGIAATAPVAAAMPAAGYLQAMGSGAVSGLMQPDLTGGDNYGMEKLKQGAIGAGSGAVGQALGRLLAPKVSPELQTLMDEGVTPTPGQVLGGVAKKAEEKLTSVPFLGGQIEKGQRRAIEDLNRAAYNRALSPIGETYQGAVGREGVQGVKDTLGAFYDKTLPNAVFKADQTFGQEVGNIAQMAKSLPEPQAKQFQTVMRDKFLSRLSPTGMMDGKTAKGVESELSRIAKGYRGDASFDNRQLGDAIDATLQSFRGALTRNSAPEVGRDLQAANLGYANYARIRDAASRLGSQEGIFTPAQLQGAVRAGDKTVGKGGFATGNALMQELSDAGQKVLGNKYPDSGTAGRWAQMNLPALAVGLGMGSLGAIPYSRMGQKAIANALTQRPEFMRQAGSALSRYDAIPFERLLQAFYQSQPQHP